MSSISIGDFSNLKGDIHLVDIRSVEKYNSSHIPGAINIPAQKLLLNPNNFLDKNVKYYLYCQHGMSSRNVVNILCKLGFDVVNISGGYESWIINKV